MKTCVDCTLNLPLDDFSDHPGTKDRKQQRCKLCQSDLMAEYQARNQRRAQEATHQHREAGTAVQVDEVVVGFGPSEFEDKPTTLPRWKIA